MALILDLTPEEEERLKHAAERHGLAAAAYLRALIRSLPEGMAAGEQTGSIGAQIVAEWEREGVIGYRTDIPDSQAHARRLREKAQNRGRV